jgi:hypothetical protein
MCPICKIQSQEIEPGIFEGAKYRCTTHGEFDVVDTALAIREFVEASTERWEAAFRKAKSRAKPGERPRISTYDF